jgi:hypothetical protein
MNRFRIPPIYIHLLVLLPCCLIGAAKGATIVNRFGPGDTHSLNAGMVIGFHLGTDLQQALSFTVPQSSDFFLDSIEVPLGLATNDAPTSSTFRILGDSGGLPDANALIEAFSIHGILGGSATIFTAPSLNRPILSAGESYWLSAANDENIGIFGWANLNDGSTPPRAVRRGFGPWVLENVSPPEDSDDLSTGGAFRINGTPIPEPGSTGLILICAVLLIIGGRRR